MKHYDLPWMLDGMETVIPATNAPQKAQKNAGELFRIVPYGEGIKGFGMEKVEAIPVSWIEEQVDKGKWAELVQRWRERNG
jgi:hypothetical protein